MLRVSSSGVGRFPWPHYALSDSGSPDVQRSAHSENRYESRGAAVLMGPSVLMVVLIYSDDLEDGRVLMGVFMGVRMGVPAPPPPPT